MPEDNPIDTVISSIEITKVDLNEISKFQRERDHFEIAFNLMRECAGYTCILASIRKNKPTWDLDDSVIGGNVVRIYKLICFVLEESIKNRAELLWILIRATSEAVITLRYLISNKSPELIKSYIVSSLQHEKKLYDEIQSNIASRGGEILPIESRMQSSILRTFKNSGVDITEVPEKKIQNWGNKNIFEKAKNVGLENAYSAIFGGPSRNVHGNWQDLLQNHLNFHSPGEFTARLEFTAARPQPIYALTYLIADTLIEYCNQLSLPILESLIDRLHSLIERNAAASNAHEEYIVAKS